MFNKNTCFAYDRNMKVCRALCKCECSKDCAFYKTKSQARTERQRANRRLASLPLAQRQYIADTYYRLQHPKWLLGAKKKEAAK